MKKRPEKFVDILEQTNRWPKTGDRLLRSSDDWNKGIEFSDQPISRHAHLWQGYLSAGEGLIKLCTQDGYEHERHFVIYPILYNYRHGLELAMKWIIFTYGGQGIGEIDDDHNLWKLWKRCRETIEQYGSPDPDTDDVIEQIVKDFQDIDKAGITFRYGWRKNGQNIKLPDHLIDLENIRDVMEGVAGYFDGLDGWLDDLNSAGP